MKKAREQFYFDIVKSKITNINASILVIGGGSLDKTIFGELGFTDVTISNLDSRASVDDFSPYKWDYQDAQSLSYGDGVFDYVVAHAAIHHGSMPHKILLEMYRVAKVGLLAFEARDSFLMKILNKLNLTQEYEHAAVFYNECLYGGVNNTEIPNYVFRWTEREIEKTIQSFNPIAKHIFCYNYGSAYPCTPQLETRNGLKIAVLLVMKPFYLLFSKIFYKQQNQFAFFIKKPANDATLFPWLYIDSETNRIRFNKAWAQKRYRTDKEVQKHLSSNN